MHDRRTQLGKPEEPEGTVAVDVQHPQVIIIARIVQNDLEVTAIAGRHKIERQLVGDELADPVLLQAA
jgi:hypothetical protein